MGDTAGLIPRSWHFFVSYPLSVRIPDHTSPRVSQSSSGRASHSLSLGAVDAVAPTFLPLVLELGELRTELSRECRHTILCEGPEGWFCNRQKRLAEMMALGGPGPAGWLVRLCRDGVACAIALRHCARARMSTFSSFLPFYCFIAANFLIFPPFSLTCEVFRPQVTFFYFLILCMC